MDDGKRLHREDPVRIGPIRNFSGLYHSSGPDTSHFPSSGSSSPDGTPTKGQEPSRDESVGLAYQVIEKHISEGKKNAGQFNNQPYNTRPIADGFQELLERTLRYGSELFPLWLEILGSSVRIDPTRTQYAGGPVGQYTGQGAQSNHLRAVSIEMISTRPVQVSLDLREDSERLPLVTLGLRTVDANKPVLNDISFTPGQTGSSVKLRISIPDAHPPGTYSGVIVNRDTGETQGTLSVRIAQ